MRAVVEEVSELFLGRKGSLNQQKGKGPYRRSTADQQPKPELEGKGGETLPQMSETEKRRGCGKSPVVVPPEKKTTALGSGVKKRERAYSTSMVEKEGRRKTQTCQPTGERGSLRKILTWGFLLYRKQLTVSR